MKWITETGLWLKLLSLLLSYVWYVLHHRKWQWNHSQIMNYIFFLFATVCVFLLKALKWFFCLSCHSVVFSFLTQIQLVQTWAWTQSKHLAFSSHFFVFVNAFSWGQQYNPSEWLDLTVCKTSLSVPVCLLWLLLHCVGVWTLCSCDPRGQ